MLSICNVFVAFLLVLYASLLYLGISKLSMVEKSFDRISYYFGGETRNPLRKLLIVSLLILTCFVARSVLLPALFYTKNTYSSLVLLLYLTLSEVLPLILTLSIFDPASSVPSRPPTIESSASFAIGSVMFESSHVVDSFY